MKWGLDKHYVLYSLEKGSVILPNLKLTIRGKFFIDPRIVSLLERKGLIEKVDQKKFPLYVWKITKKGSDKLHAWEASHPIAW